MSLLHNAGGWLTRDGEPVVGITPPSVRMRTGEMTPARRGLVQAAYMQFLQARRLSLSGGGFFVANSRLADGTVVRAISIEGVDHIHVWASDAVMSFGSGVTFWCQPWDDEWIDGPYAEVFTIPRWFEIGGGEVEDDAPEDFLDDLVRNAGYEPPAATEYPGNQTWFAAPPHPSAGVVVSWRGQHRRYANNLLDRTVDSAGVWRRAPDPSVTFVQGSIEAPLVAPTGGIAGAVAGHTFHKEGETALPPSVTTTPIRQRPPATNAVWVNGARVNTPGGFVVSSACLGYRAGVPVIRAVRIVTGVVTVIEQNPNSPGAWITLGTISITASNIGLPHPIINTSNGTSTQTGAGWTGAVEVTHPFYWNADGTEAVGLMHYLKNATGQQSAAGVHALLRITLTGTTCSIDLIEHSRTTADSSLNLSENDSPGNYTRSSASSSDNEYVGVVAADFRQNEMVVVRTHIESDTDTTGSVSETNESDTVLFDYVQWEGTSVEMEVTLALPNSSYSRTEARQDTRNTSTWASLNGAVVGGTSESRAFSQSYSWTRQASKTYSPVINPGYMADGSSTAFKYLASLTEETDTRASGVTASASGGASVWGVCAGDLRGAFVIHAAPLDGAQESSAAHADMNYNWSESSSLGSSSTGSATYSRTQRPDTGRLVGVSGSGGASIRTRLVHPRRIGQLGSGFASFVGGGLTSSSSSGPYGAGPAFGSFGLPPNTIAAGNISSTTTRVDNTSRNYASDTYPSGAPAAGSNGPVSSYIAGSSAGAGNYSNTVLSGSALTPDLRVQYTGAVFVAMVSPSDLSTPITHHIDEWLFDGSEFTPDYPDQTDPEAPGGTSVFPHRGDHSILLDPIFIGPLP
jgi:hypothetical protein